jgi:hypothetical protein
MERRIDESTLRAWRLRGEPPAMQKLEELVLPPPNLIGAIPYTHPWYSL